jgi:ribosome-associated protein
MKKLTFQLNHEFIELNKLLKVMGLCESSGFGKVLVASGLVQVDGKTELRKACKIRAGSVITFEDASITVIGPTP